MTDKGRATPPGTYPFTRIPELVFVILSRRIAKRSQETQECYFIATSCYLLRRISQSLFTLHLTARSDKLAQRVQIAHHNTPRMCDSVRRVIRILVMLNMLNAAV